MAIALRVITITKRDREERSRKLIGLDDASPVFFS